MSSDSFFFAGGGTGGHIYPAIAVAEKIIEMRPNAKVHFFISDRDIDSQILSKTTFPYTKLSAKGFSLQPGRLVEFCRCFLKSTRLAKQVMAAKPQAENEAAVLVGVGGFVAAPACWAAHKLKIPVALLNVDSVPGRANKIIARWADEIFVQFEQTREYFAGRKATINVFGCPLRSGFENPEPDKIKSCLNLDKNKRILLVAGGSSGAANINEAVCLLLERLAAFAEDWQIVHLTGISNYDKIKRQYASAKISHKVLDYFDDMANLLAASDLVVGRSGAGSVAEYSAACVPSICMPYPYHKDMHQYRNAGELVDVGAGIIVDDLPDAKERADWLWEELELLLKDEKKRQEMKKACGQIANKDAAVRIAERLIKKADRV
jgi:UDP-N-acetylglucosamine--N-acetylmuramyl-(pentapeptide) pyrophosphoryl-undecaprenol N-acetylglucosamine transferase